MAPTTTVTPCIVARHLTKRFGEVTAVDNLSLSVREGECVGVLGPTGAGKTTTIKMLCGLVSPTAGTISIAGYNPCTQAQEVNRRIGVVPDRPALYERLTGQVFLEFTGRLHGLSFDDAHYRTAELLDLMDLTDAQDQRIVDYSTGMKKKIAMAAAIVHHPKILLLDEPFKGTDPISGRTLYRVLQQLTQQGATLFFTSQVLEDVEHLCTRVVIMHRGVIVGEGTLADLRVQVVDGNGAWLKDRSEPINTRSVRSD